MQELPPKQNSRLTKQNLESMSIATGIKYVVTVHETGAGVQFDGQEQNQTITTSRGDMKVWRNLTGAISFVQENCKTASEVFVEVDGWRFIRTHASGSTIPGGCLTYQFSKS
jgi:hypothetical protein